MTHKRFPLWQWLVCGVLCVGGLVALGANLVGGQVHGAASICSWLFGLAGACIFGRTALAREPRQRDPSSLPKPSDAVQRLAESGQRIAAIKAYRAQAGASLHEAQAVLAGYWG